MVGLHLMLSINKDKYCRGSKKKKKIDAALKDGL